MVCQRCIAAVKNVFETSGVKVSDAHLGEVDVHCDPSTEQADKIRLGLKNIGFELIDDKRSRLIEQVKNAIVSLIHHNQDEKIKVNFSDYLSEKIGRDYNYLSNLFSEVEGVTIERYMILQRIERVKELLVYDELTLSEIAYQLGYSSVAHLSGQFKKVTGLTPSHYKQIRDQKRKPLDEIG
jgi:AraC family transcriptional regulator